MTDKVIKFPGGMLVLFALLGVISCGGSMVPEFEHADAVDAVFSAFDKPDSPGCSLAVIRDGEIVYSCGYGMANLENNIPITPETVFYFGSESKQFVTFCLLLLEEQGKLSLDDDVRDYVPEIPDYGETITIRHLCHHTSGLRDYFELWAAAGIDYMNYHPESDVIELLSRQKELNFMPGEQRMYCNSGYLLLSAIIRRVSGMSLPEFADRNIFTPLGMANTHFHDDPGRLVPHRADGHMRSGDDGWELLPFRFALVGSGGMYTNVEDLLFWDRNFYDNRLSKGGQETIDRMTTRGHLNNGESFDYGLALAVGEYRGLRTVRHGGSLGGYRTHMLRFPDEHFTVITLFNLGNVNPAEYVEKVADICLAGKLAPKETAPVSQTGNSVSGSQETETADIAAEKCKEFEGDFHSGELMMTATLKADDKGLVYMKGMRPLMTFRYGGDDRFVTPAAEIRFQRGRDGAVQSFRLDSGRVKNLLFEKNK